MKTKEVRVTKTTDIDSKVNQLVLQLKDLHLNGVKDADISHQLFALGTKTETIQRIEKVILDPIESLSDMVNEMDDKVKELVGFIANSFFETKKDILESVYKGNAGRNILHYSVVLKKDNQKNRKAIFTFFDVYDCFSFSSKYPVHFQFTPREMVDKIKVKEVLTFV